MAIIQLIVGDSIEIMKGMLGRVSPSFDMIFLDPPYFEWDEQTTKGLKPDHNILSKLCFQLLKPNGTIFLCGTQPQLAKDWKYWERYFNLNFELVAIKSSGTPPVSMRRPLPWHENIWCLWKKTDNLKDIKIDIRRVASEGTEVVEKIRERITQMRTRYGNSFVKWKEGCNYPKSVVIVPKIDAHNKEYVGHPAQKSLKLMRIILKMAVEPGDWVLDPFAGAGTTLVVCKEYDINCIGIEINPEYARMAKKRLERIEALRRLQEWAK